MPKPNNTFELSVEDLERIEVALRARQSETPEQAESREINELLGRLHNQKTFYRPAQGTYIGG